MAEAVNLNAVYIPGELVAREIEGEFILVPLTSGIGDMEDELYTLNQTARAVWDRLNGKKTLKQVVEEMVAEYNGPAGEIEADVKGLVEELLKRKMLVESTKG